MADQPSQALNQFLASVEKRAYRIAYIATGNREDALDVIQDAMLKLTVNYADRSLEDWGPLFHRILQSTIRDWYRRQKVRNQWRTWLEYTRVGFQQLAGGKSVDGGSSDGQTQNVIDLFEDVNAQEPVMQLVNERTIDALESALHRLPLRQQQAFMLRVWEGLNVEETAQAMGCTQGSVKTHYSRAVHTLRKQLEDHRS